MKLSMYSGFNEFFSKYGPQQAVAKAQALGFDGIEVLDDPALFTRETMEALRLALEQHHMKMSCYSAYVTLCGEMGESTEQRLYRCAEFAAFLGCPYLHHTLVGRFAPPPATLQADPAVVDEVLTRAARVADYAAAQGVQCIYEEQGFVFNGVQRMQQLFDRLAPRESGFCADCGNCLFVDEEPEAYFSAFHSRIRNIHIKDYYRDSSARTDRGTQLRSFGGAWLADAHPGKGCLDLSACLALAGPNYNGYCALEYWPSGLSEEECRALVRDVRALER